MTSSLPARAEMPTRPPKKIQYGTDLRATETRIRSALAAESTVDLAEHAARVLAVVEQARRNARHLASDAAAATAEHARRFLEARRAP